MSDYGPADVVHKEAVNTQSLRIHRSRSHEVSQLDVFTAFGLAVVYAPHSFFWGENFQT